MRAFPGRVEASDRVTLSFQVPGLLTKFAVKEGQKVAKGDLLLTMEAMKMETSVRAEADGTVAEVLAKPGMQVDAKDLLIVLG